MSPFSFALPGQNSCRREDPLPEGPHVLLELLRGEVLLPPKPLRHPLLLPGHEQIGRDLHLFHAAVPMERHAGGVLRVT